MSLRVSEGLIHRAGLVLMAAILLALISPFAYFGLSLYLASHRGYGLECTSETLAEAVSPAGEWVARARLISCGGVPGGQWVDAVLVPRTVFSFLSPDQGVFRRSVDSSSPDGGERLTVRWIDDHSLELRGVPCLMCQGTEYHQPCDSECKVVNDVDGIAVSLKPPEN